MKPIQPSYPSLGAKNDKIDFTRVVNLQGYLEERDSIGHDPWINVVLFLWVCTCYTPFIM